MNFLQQVLSTVESVAADTLKKELPELLVQASTLRDEVRKYIEEIYTKCLTQVNRDNKYVFKVTSLKEQAESLRKHLNELLKDELTHTKESIVEYKESLVRIDVWLSISSQLCEINEEKLKIVELIKNKEYDKAVIAFHKIEECYKLSSTEKIETMISLLSHISLLIEKMLCNLNDMIKTSIIMKLDEQSDSSTLSLSITKNDELPTAFKALSMYEENIESLDDLVRFIWDANTVIVNKFTNITVKIDGDCKTIILSSTEKKNTYKNVFAGIIALAEFLFDHFNYELHNHGSIINYISESIMDNLVELIIKYCLDGTIPDDKKDLEKYQEVIDDTALLQNKLIEIGIFKKHTNAILEHAKNVDQHFINKKCETYRLEAENIMKKDLHNIVTMGKPFNAADLTSTEFPQCAISKNVNELLALIKSILEAASSPDLNHARLLVTANGILQKYAPFVNEYHKTFLQTIPQQLAIFYNNCKYIVHQTSQPNWRNLYLKIQKTNDYTLFDTLIFEINTFADNLLKDYLKTQLQQIELTINDCGITATKTCEKLPPSVEKSIRQCLRQQELLKTVWQKILSYYDYNKSVGRLLDCLCKSLIKSILYLDDISSDAAENITETFKGVQTRGPKIFTDPKEINLFVKNWHKFNELLYVLNSKLINISDRWADGKGPLALHFKAEEIRTLIRALFQNTDRRDAVLAQIRNI